MSGRKQLKLLRTLLTDSRLGGIVAVSFVASLLYFCCCGISCADAPISQVDTATHGGCCSPDPAQPEPQDRGCCGDDCDCTLKGEQDTYVLAEGYHAPTPALYILPPVQYSEPELHGFYTFPTPGTSDRTRAPPLYLRFQTLLI